MDPPRLAAWRETAVTRLDPDLRLRSGEPDEFCPKVDANERADSQAFEVTKLQWGSVSEGVEEGIRRRW